MRFFHLGVTWYKHGCGAFSSHALIGVYLLCDLVIVMGHEAQTPVIAALLWLLLISHAAVVLVPLLT